MPPARALQRGRTDAEVAGGLFESQAKLGLEVFKAQALACPSSYTVVVSTTLAAPDLVVLILIARGPHVSTNVVLLLLLLLLQGLGMIHAGRGLCPACLRIRASACPPTFTVGHDDLHDGLLFHPILLHPGQQLQRLRVPRQHSLGGSTLIALALGSRGSVATKAAPACCRCNTAAGAGDGVHRADSGSSCCSRNCRLLLHGLS
mmetsp:Transcript_18225/g.51038  ORF Transcript_18225/g.51038 Transcript_18225/m.51038 type:complete len:204 (-) Transcript_18225:849-1460(-)